MSAAPPKLIRCITMSGFLKLMALILTSSGMMHGGVLTAFGYARVTSDTIPIELGSGVDFSSGDVLSDAQSIGSGSGLRFSMSSHAVAATFGYLGMSFSATTACSASDITCGVESADGEILLSSSDLLTFWGVTDGVFALEIYLDGTIATNISGLIPFDSRVTYSIGAPNIPVSFSAFSQVAYGVGAVSSQSQAHGSAVTTSLETPAANTAAYRSQGIVLIPFTGGNLYLDQRLEGSWFCPSGRSQACAISANFMNSARVGSAQILDSNGTVIPGATVTSDSGFDYTAAIPLSDVPEPTSYMLTFLGASLLGTMRTIRNTLRQSGNKQRPASSQSLRN